MKICNIAKMLLTDNSNTPDKFEKRPVEILVGPNKQNTGFQRD